MNSDVKISVRNWLARTADDWDAVEMLTRYPDCPRNVVCFHCQQNVEKLLKAFLTLHQIEFPKTHSLALLIESSVRMLPALAELLDESDNLTNHAVTSGYQDDFREASQSDMKQAIELTKRFNNLLNSQFKNIRKEI
jgi:HEPN domain-containing protein